MEFIRVDGIYKRYNNKKREVDVLKGINLAIAKKETVAVVGASGVGKSTFLHILGALDRPTEGDVFYSGEPV
ncbi:MAG: ATP-binding cassette domain-containing protein, partial [Deltaproteobacteria bacterium]|nr:ATP-binding cassette domain-containing protein [Deltaproteobacteria bacterium]